MANYSNPLQADYFRAKQEAAAHKERLDRARKEWQAACPHKNVVEEIAIRAPKVRECLDCDVRELQPVAAPGDEYAYALYGQFKILTGYTVPLEPVKYRKVLRD
jgi:hypothetical protein